MRTMVWASGLLSLALLIGLGVYLLPLQPSLVTLQFTFTPQAFDAVLLAWQTTGVALFRNHLWVDYGLLAAYGVFGYVLSTRTGIFSNSSALSRRVAPWLMPLAAVSDFMENSLHLFLTASAAPATPLLYALAGSSATLKFLAMFAFAVVVARARFKPNP